MANILTDDFNRGANGDPVGNSWVTDNFVIGAPGGSPDVFVDGTRGIIQLTADSQWYYAHYPTDATSDQQIQFESIMTASGSGRKTAGLVRRMSSNTFYRVTNQGNGILLEKSVSGSVTQLGSTISKSISEIAERTILKAVGGQITVRHQRLDTSEYLDTGGSWVAGATDCISVNDTSIDGVGGNAYAGVAINTNQGFRVLIDNVSIDSVVVAPTEISAQTSTDGQDVVLTFSTVMLPTSSISGFSVEVNNVSRGVSSVVRSATNQFTLTLSSPVIYSDTITHSYTPGNVTDVLSTPLEAFSDTDVTNMVGTITDSNDYGDIVWSVQDTLILNTDYGQLLDGSYEILDPGGGIVISSVSPAPTGSGSSFRNGSAVNYVVSSADNTQPFDGRLSYDSGKGTTFPVTLNAGDSLISVISMGNDETITDVDGRTLNPNGTGDIYQTYIKRVAILTCVSSLHGATYFRPSFYGTERKWYSTADVRTDLLPSLSKTLNTPAISTVTGKIAGPFFDALYEFGSRLFHPATMSNYGREIAYNSSIASGLLMFSDNGDRTLLLRRYIQQGLDLYGALNSGLSWPANGGHGQGRKAYILIGGYFLNDSDMMGVGSLVRTDTDNQFQEDEQTDYMTAEDIAAGTGYDNTWLGKAEWGINYYLWKHSGYVSGNPNVASIDADYRAINGPRWTGYIAATVLLGIKPLWNHSALFDYMDWYIPDAISNGDLNGEDFLQELWELSLTETPANPSFLLWFM